MLRWLLSIIIAALYGDSSEEPAQPDTYGGALTFRISNIPHGISDENLLEELAKLANITLDTSDSTDYDERIRLRSLAPSPDNAATEQIAIVTFNPVPVFLRDAQNGSEPVQVRLTVGSTRFLAYFDTHFIGLTPLNDVSTDARFDLIFVTGLAGHAYGSWKTSKKTTMWIQDFLVDDVRQSNFRILTYGYNSKVQGSTSSASVSDFARAFLQSVCIARHLEVETSRPIIFVGHSLGGLVIKQALIQASGSKNNQEKKIFTSTLAIVSLGVPHRGLEIDALMSMVRDQANENLIRDLKANSQYLVLVHETFCSLFAEVNLRTISVHETRLSKTVKKDIKDGSWSKTGELVQMVTMDSAVPSGPTEELYDRLSRDTDHSGISKFRDRSDQDYKILLRKILDCTNQNTNPATLSSTVNKLSIDESKVYFVVHLHRDESFIGRTFYMEQLESRLGLKGKHCRLALYGLGGIGKTRLALEYAFKYEHSKSTSVFWVRANNEGRKAQLQGIDDPGKDGLQIVKTWLEGSDCGTWVMIIDNADDHKLFYSKSESKRLASYLPLPRSHGSILLTTRDKKLGIDFTTGNMRNCIELTAMSAIESEEIITSGISNGDDGPADTSSIHELCSFLEGHPLALVQARAFIKRNTMPIKDYLKLYSSTDSNKIDLLSQDFEDMYREPEIKNPITTTWLISFNQIKVNDLKASELLSFMSLLDNKSVPKVLLPGNTNTVEFHNAVGTLIAYSLLKTSQEGKEDAYELHRLVHLVARNWLRIEKTLDRWSTVAVQTLLDHFPAYEYKDNNMQLWRKYMPHAISVLEPSSLSVALNEPLEKMRILLRVAQCLILEGNYIRAEQFSREAMDIGLKELGNEDEATLIAMGSLVTCYNNLEKWDQAQTLGESVLEKRTRLLGPEHSSTLTSKGNLAVTYMRQELFDKAEALEIEVLESRKRIPGLLESDLLSDKNNLAAIYRSQGRLDEAEGLETELLETSQHVNGDEHPDTILCMNNLSLTMYTRGRHEEAVALREKALDIEKRVIGPEHPSTLASMRDLSYFYSELPRFDRAEAVDVSLLDIQTRLLGPEHEDTLGTMARLITDYMNLRQFDKAEAVLVPLIEIRTLLSGFEHEDTLLLMSSLATIYGQQERRDEAMALRTTVLETRKRILGTEHPDTLDAMVDLVYDYYPLDQLDEAEALIETVIEARKRVLGVDHPDTLDSIELLSDIYLRQRQRRDREQGRRRGQGRAAARLRTWTHESEFEFDHMSDSSYW